MKYKLIIFDLDGTILDTLDDLSDSVNFSLSSMGLPLRTREEVRSFVGNGIRLLIERSVPDGCDVETTVKVFDIFRHHYKDNCCNNTKPYVGIIDLLQNLRSEDIKLAVVSNKADFAVKEIVARYFDGLFDYAAGEKEGIPRKPAPDSVFDALNFFGLEKSDALYIGDSEVDVETAKNAGLEIICVDWGFREAECLKEHGASVIFSDSESLIKYLFR